MTIEDKILEPYFIYVKPDSFTVGQRTKVDEGTLCESVSNHPDCESAIAEIIQLKMADEEVSLTLYDYNSRLEELQNDIADSIAFPASE